MVVRPSDTLSDSSGRKMWARPTSSRSLPMVLLLLIFIGATLTSFIGTREVSAQTVIAPPTFDVPHGLYSSPFKLSLASPSGGSIRYTLDGSSPTASVGTLYNSHTGIQITK